MSEPTVETVIHLDDLPKGPVRKFPLVIVTAAFLVFPPVGFALMWADQTYHKNFKIFLVIVGIAFVLVGLSTIFLLQKLDTGVYAQLEQKPNLSLAYSLNFSTAAVGILDVVFAFFFRSTSKAQVATAALFLIVGSFGVGLVVGVSILLALIPIYSTTAGL